MHIARLWLVYYIKAKNIVLRFSWVRTDLNSVAVRKPNVYGAFNYDPGFYENFNARVLKRITTL